MRVFWREAWLQKVDWPVQSVVPRLASSMRCLCYAPRVVLGVEVSQQTPLITARGSGVCGNRAALLAGLLVRHSHPVSPATRLIVQIFINTVLKKVFTRLSTILISLSSFMNFFLSIMTVITLLKNLLADICMGNRVAGLTGWL